jgi:ADP-heptose:LPS heptosyltransferase
MIITGQLFIMDKAVARKARKVLWYYDWETIGDALMDLSQRFLIPSDVSVDLCMPYGPIALFVNDSRFRRIFNSLAECDSHYDLIIIQNLTTKTLFNKIRHFPLTHFFTIMGHKRNEDFSRMELSYERLAQFFEFDRTTGPIEPYIALPTMKAPKSEGVQILVAVGGNDKRRRFDGWAAVIRSIDEQWPASHAKPTYMLVGADRHAKEAAALISAQFPIERIACRLDLPDIATVAETIEQSSFFVGADGGLMHIAAALRKPGVGIFSEIHPEWRLHRNSKMKAIFTKGEINEIAVDQISNTVLDYFMHLMK